MIYRIIAQKQGVLFFLMGSNYAGVSESLSLIPPNKGIQRLTNIQNLVSSQCR